jgi:hypothetical protein
MRKQAKIHFFRIERKKNVAFISLRSENYGSFSLPFRFISLRSEIMVVFRFSFASFRFEAKMMAVLRFFFVLFSLRSIFVSLQISTVRIDAKQAKKALFSHRSEKNFAFVSLHFASKRK